MGGFADLIGPIVSGIGSLFGGGGSSSGGGGILGSALGGLLGNSGQNQGSFTSASTFTPDQSSLQNQLYQSLSARLANPNINLDPLKTQAYGAVNRNYQGLGDRLTSSFASRGFGRGGNLANNQTQLELGRQGDLGDIESRFAGYNLDQQNKNLDMASRFGFADPGKSGNTTGPNNPLSGFLGGALSGLGSAYGAGGSGQGSNTPPFYSGGGSGSSDLSGLGDLGGFIP